MNNLKYVVNIGFYGDYHFIFDNANEAVAFAIAAKLKDADKRDEVSIDFVEAEDEQ